MEIRKRACYLFKKVFISAPAMGIMAFQLTPVSPPDLPSTPWPLTQRPRLSTSVAGLLTLGVEKLNVRRIIIMCIAFQYLTCMYIIRAHPPPCVVRGVIFFGREGYNRGVIFSFNKEGYNRGIIRV